VSEDSETCPEIQPLQCRHPTPVKLEFLEHQLSPALRYFRNIRLEVFREFQN